MVIISCIEGVVQTCSYSMGDCSITLITAVHPFLTYCFESTHHNRTDMPILPIDELGSDCWGEGREWVCLPAQD